MNEKAEPDLKEDQDHISFAEFLDIIIPAFPDKSTRQDITACLKRSHWIVNMNKAVYVRKAGVAAEDVPLVHWPSDAPDFISEDGKKVLGAMREGILTAPSTWLEKRQWSHDWLSLLLDNRQTPPRAIKISGLGIFDGKKFSREEKAEMPFSGRICSLPDIPGDSSAPGLPSMPAHMQAEKPVVKVKQELPDRPHTPRFNRLDSTLSKGTIELDTPSPNPKRPKTVNAELDVHDQFPDFGEAPEDES